jgi:hypothetical protein
VRIVNLTDISRPDMTTGKIHVKDEPYLQSEWCQVVGNYVQIRRGNCIVRTGLVEAVTADDAILWIAGHGAERRALYERAHGHTVWAGI